MRVIGVAALCGLVGCGDPVVGAEYAGDPLFTLGGIARHEDDEVLPEGDLYVTILFSRRSDEGYTWLPPLRVETGFPASYTLNIYSPPPDDHLQPRADGIGLVGLGAPMLYIDLDGDAWFDPEIDPRAGTSDGVVLFYFTEPVPAESGSEGLGAGFHAVDLHGRCPGESRMDEVDPLSVDLIVKLDAPGVIDHCAGEGE